ncbi:MAG TPA: response regulator [Verrucomicrobiae bacterium]|nr:response regulator [Verrucomicrobiae bacterium]
MPDAENLILVVDDNDDDRTLIARTFQRAGIQNRLRLVNSGIDAIGYLKGDPPYQDRTENPLPTVVMLDIKMPGVDGFEVLRWIRQQWQLKRMCVVMLTSSDEIRDVNQAYQLGANSFLVKPLDFVNATELVRSLDRMVERTRPPGFAAVAF